MEGRTHARLDALATIVTGGTPPASQPESWGNDVPFITPSDQNEWKREAIPSRYLSRLGADRLGKKIVPAGSTNLTCIASIGKVSMATEPCVTNQQINTIIAKPAKINSTFLYYMIRNWSPLLKEHASGSATPIINKTILSGYEFDIPCLTEQKAIAEVLGALDDKIAANTKLADTAQDLLQTAYRGLSLRCDLSPVRVETLVQRLTPNRRFTKEELKPSGDFPVFDQSESGFLGYLDGNGYLDANPEDPVLYFGDHTCQLRISSENFTVGPNTVPFRGVNIPALTLYCALNGLQRHEEYKRHWLSLMKKEVCVPDNATASQFARTHTPLLALFKDTREENTTLAATRDTLLPQLMSGKLRVRDIENTMGEMV